MCDIRASSKSSLDLAELGSVNAANVGSLACKLVDRVQKFPHTEQAAAFGVAVLLISQKLGCRPGDLLQTGDNILKKAAEKNPEMRGLRAYVENYLGTRR